MRRATHPTAFVTPLVLFVNGIARFVKRSFRFRPHLDKNERSGMLRPSSPTIRRWVMYWLAWTAAGLFYITQDFMTRLSRNESMPWRNVVIGWMAAMYVCAAFTPPILRLGRRWPVAEAFRWRRIALQLGASVAFALGIDRTGSSCSGRTWNAASLQGASLIRHGFLVPSAIRPARRHHPLLGGGRPAGSFPIESGSPPARARSAGVEGALGTTR